MMKDLLFGTAGIPISTPDRNTENGIRHVRVLGLGCMELEFVHSVNITKEKAPQVRKVAEQNDVLLTCHGQYYINLNAAEKAKLEASKQRIINAARTAHFCGAWSCTFHPGFYLKKTREEAYERIKTALAETVKKLRDNGVKIWVRPETTGKHSQMGDLQECIRLSQDIEGVLPCIDFAHLHARANGGVNKFEEFCEQLKLVEKELGKEALKNMHIHYSGINYSAKGELNHLELQDSDADYKGLVRALKEFKCAGCAISESPNIEKDATLLKKAYDSL